MLDELRRADQLVDDRVALFPHGAGVGEEGAHFLRGRRQAGEIEINAAEKIRIAAQVRRLDFHPLPFGGDEFVDAAPGLRLLPGEARAVAHHGQRRRGVVALVAREQRRFAAAQRLDEAAALGLGHIGVAAVDERLGGHVARLAIAESRDDAHLLPRADLLHDGIARKNLDLRHARRVEVELRAVGDPRAQDFVILFAELRPLPALVRHARRGLEQHQRIIRRRHIHFHRHRRGFPGDFDPQIPRPVAQRSTFPSAAAASSRIPSETASRSA